MIIGGEPGVMVHICYGSTWWAESGGLAMSSRPVCARVRPCIQENKKWCSRGKRVHTALCLCASMEVDYRGQH